MSESDNSTTLSMVCKMAINLAEKIKDDFGRGCKLQMYSNQPPS